MTSVVALSVKCPAQNPPIMVSYIVLVLKCVSVLFLCCSSVGCFFFVDSASMFQYAMRGKAPLSIILIENGYITRLYYGFVRLAS